MNNLVGLRVVATPEAALKKLAKAQIPVYNLKKHGAYLDFGVTEEYVEKAFAIFARPCYNIRIRRKSRKMKVLGFLKRRLGLAVGAALFTFAVFFSGLVVFRIRVTGSGTYLTDTVIALARDCGAREWSLCGKLDKPLLEAKILALPDVSFCSVQRKGAYLLIDVRTGDKGAPAVQSRSLTANASGVVQRIVAVCGTPERSAGDKVSVGDTLIGAYSIDAEGQREDCLAVGFAEICVSADISLFFTEESEESERKALSAPALYSDRVTEKSFKVKPCDGGVTYEVSFSYIVTAAINME